jgi:enoyl-CoA hydratase
MSREQKRNAIDAEMSRGIDDALNELDDNQDLWAGVLTGTATVFSAGTDLRLGAGEPSSRGGPYGIIRRRRRKPLVAAVEGPAVGGGLEIVLACDLVVAATNAVFGLPEVARGVLPTCGGLFRGPRALPLNVARELILTGRSLSATRAHHFGLVNELVPPGSALTGAIALAQEICDNAPVSVSECLWAMETVISSEDELGWSATQKARERVFATNDRAEGNAAFFEHRPPIWTGR